jgi:heterodisulfide reductase subunit A-like polyferredoxin
VSATRGALGHFSTTLTHGSGRTRQVDHGVVILATGGQESNTEEYLYGKHANVLTHLDLDAACSTARMRGSSRPGVRYSSSASDRATPSGPIAARSAAPTASRAPWRSKALNPKMKVFILYRDIRAYGFREALYQQARPKV